MNEYRDDLVEMQYLIGKALDEVPYGAPSDIQQLVNDVEVELIDCYNKVREVLNKIQEMK